MGKDGTVIKNLREKLLKNYDAGARPVLNYKTATNVTFGMAVRTVALVRLFL